MQFDSYADITNQAIKVALMVSAPMLIGALVMGIVVSFFQAVTQINEPWMSDTLTTFTKDLILNIPRVIAER